MTTETLTRPVESTTSTGDPLLTHIVNCPPDKPSTEAWLTEARVYGLVVEALCGHRWVPSRDPERYPVCHLCIEARDAIIADVNRGAGR